MHEQTGMPHGERALADATSGEVIRWCPEQNSERSNGTETILFVEDEVFVRRVITEVLCAAGYEVLTAPNAEDALRLYERNAGAVDLLLTDLVLPGQTGSELAAALTGLDHRIEVLYVTGYMEQVRKLEGHNCLPKPFSTSALLGKVRQVLDQRQFAAAV